jgi:hypothetical protein
MGSSDPLPARFEIRFWSLNFQATGNDYLMHITNRDQLHPWCRPGRAQCPPCPLLTLRHPPRRMLQALRLLGTDGAQASARARLHAPRHEATRSPMGRWRSQENTRP